MEVDFKREQVSSERVHLNRTCFQRSKHCDQLLSFPVSVRLRLGTCSPLRSAAPSPSKVSEPARTAVEPCDYFHVEYVLFEIADHWLFVDRRLQKENFVLVMRESLIALNFGSASWYAILLCSIWKLENILVLIVVFLDLRFSPTMWCTPVGGHDDQLFLVKVMSEFSWLAACMNCTSTWCFLLLLSTTACQSIKCMTSVWMTFPS